MIDWWIASSIEFKEFKLRNDGLWVCGPIHSIQSHNSFHSLINSITSSLSIPIKPREMEWSKRFVFYGMEFARGEGWAPAITNNKERLTYLSSIQSNAGHHCRIWWMRKEEKEKKEKKKLLRPKQPSTRLHEERLIGWMAWLAAQPELLGEPLVEWGSVHWLISFSLFIPLINSLHSTALPALPSSSIKKKLNFFFNYGCLLFVQ